MQLFAPHSIRMGIRLDAETLYSIAADSANLKEPRVALQICSVDNTVDHYYNGVLVAIATRESLRRKILFLIRCRTSSCHVIVDFLGEKTYANAAAIHGQCELCRKIFNGTRKFCKNSKR
jgi:hypothetical protein